MTRTFDRKMITWTISFHRYHTGKHISSDKPRIHEIYIFFALSGFSFTDIYDSQDSKGRGMVSI